LATAQADLDDIQTRLPASLSGGRMRSQVEGMDADTVTDSAIATDAIGSAELAASAVNEIADQVWDELIAGHLGAGSTGEALNNAGAGGDPSAIADAVWDEARAGHVAAGSFGEGVASVQGNVTGSVASVTGAVGSVAAGGITAASIATDAIDSDAIAASAVTEIQSGLATAAAVAAVQADTDDLQTRIPATLNGGRMRSHVEAIDAGTITAAVVATGAIDADALATDAVNEIVDQVWEEQIGDHSGTVGSTAEALADAATGGSAPTAGQIADAVWDEALADHVAAGSMGANQNLIDNVPADTSAAVTAAHGVGSYVEVAAPSAAAVADAVWDEVLAGHLTAGSTGAALDDAAAGGAGLTQQQVRDALKLAPSAGAPAADSIDAELDSIMGAGFATGTDSLTEIRDRVDECCGVGGGGDEVNIEGI
jgi:hypothetical protein